MIRPLILIAFSMVLSSCATVSSWLGSESSSQGSDKDVAAHPSPSEMSPDHVKPGTIPELELKYAKLWTKVDDLDRLIRKQRQRIRVLEKGLLLGIIPEELKGDGEYAEDDAADDRPSAAAAQRKSREAGLAPIVDTTSEPALGGAQDQKLTQADASQSADGNPSVDYQQKMSQAHESFRAGRYGRAIVEFAAIGKEFGDEADGGAWKFWTARCWTAMKEFQTARQHFTEFLSAHPNSPWAPRANVEMARVENALGLKETALQRLRTVIQQHPFAESAEMAKMELKNMQRAL
jgi:TolA-binding protein